MLLSRTSFGRSYLVDSAHYYFSFVELNSQVRVSGHTYVSSHDAIWIVVRVIAVQLIPISFEERAVLSMYKPSCELAAMSLSTFCCCVLARYRHHALLGWKGASVLCNIFRHPGGRDLECYFRLLWQFSQDSCAVQMIFTDLSRDIKLRSWFAHLPLWGTRTTFAYVELELAASGCIRDTR